MFDIGFWEITIIALVALVVIGPERLPGVARTAGKWVGKTRRFVNQVKSDIDLEVRQEEIKQALERDAGLDEIKQIMNSDQYILEEDTNEYQVKAIPDEKQDEYETVLNEFEPNPDDEHSDTSIAQDTAEQEKQTEATEDSKK